MKNRVNIEHLDKLRAEVQHGSVTDKRCITVCGGAGCHAQNSGVLVGVFREEVRKAGIADEIDIWTTGCHGFCERGPIVVIHPEGIFYEQVKTKDAEEIVSETIVKRKVIPRLLHKDPQSKQRIERESDIPFYTKQNRVILGNNGLIDPTDIRDYLTLDGYQAFIKVLQDMTPEEVIAEIKTSGLRGRGGGGFTTGEKWERCRASESDIKYIVCNAHGSDPGAFMDRSVLEGNPHSIIEGMLIGAYAIGAAKGYIYTRMDYPLAVTNARIAVKQARKHGLLGDSILGSGFSFDLQVFESADAFVSGEETSVLASIQGERAVARPKPPYPVEEGLWGKPTNVNNVETWANISRIIARGTDWYRSIGNGNSKGTKIFSLLGKINNTGLVEVPLGTTPREIVYDIGGGVKNKKKLKAIQVGGPTGGCIPASMMDMPLDYEHLAEAGAIMGSGGIIVMDEDSCMVDAARYAVNFTRNESCGRCAPCRLGIGQMYEILTQITEGRGEEDDIERLENLADTIKTHSLCNLGRTAPNPVLTTLRYFRDEYIAHVKDKFCPAALCKELVEFSVVREKCTGCQRCVSVCPTGAITGPRAEPHNLDASKCIKCRACYEICRFDAIAGNAIVITSERRSADVEID